MENFAILSPYLRPLHSEPQNNRFQYFLPDDAENPVSVGRRHRARRPRHLDCHALLLFRSRNALPHNKESVTYASCLPSSFYFRKHFASSSYQVEAWHTRKTGFRGETITSAVRDSNRRVFGCVICFRRCAGRTINSVRFVVTLRRIIRRICGLEEMFYSIMSASDYNTQRVILRKNLRESNLSILLRPL